MIEHLPVFVYGTLRPGEKNHPAYLAGRTLAELPASISGQLYFVADGGYPYVIEGEGRVWGELIRIAPAHYTTTLKALDALEEYDPANEKDSVYVRRAALVRLADGSEERAWVYYWNCAQVVGRRIAGGDFKHSKG